MKRIYIFCGVMVLTLMTTMTAMASTYETGVVEYRPYRTAGVWVIDEQAFFSTSRTRFDHRSGIIAIRSCVNVEYYMSGELRFITKIESVPQSNCNPRAAHNNTNNTGNSNRNGSDDYGDDNYDVSDNRYDDYDSYNSNDDDDYSSHNSNDNYDSDNDDDYGSYDSDDDDDYGSYDSDDDDDYGSYDSDDDD